MYRKILIGLAILGLLGGTQVWAGSSKIQPELATLLDKTPPGNLVSVMIYPPVTADLSIYAPTQKAEMVKRLQDVAAETQANILGYLHRVQKNDIEEKEAPRVKDIQSFWVANNIVCKVTKEIVYHLAERPDVALIEMDAETHIIAQKEENPPQVLTCEWNVHRVRADTCWRLRSYDGTGVVVGHCDTGFRPTQNAFSGRVRASNQWFDAVNGNTTPYDDNGHGTHTMGSMAGFVTGTNDTIGVAKGATITGAKTMNSAGSGTSGQAEAAYQWYATLAGKDSGAVVISNSWGYASQGVTAHIQSVENLKSLGTLSVFAAGNSGGGANSCYSPGDYPSVFAVGNVTSGDAIYANSGRGPGPSGGWYDSTRIFLDSLWVTTHSRLKPDVNAPGTSIVSAYYGSDNGTTTMSGTSMACPHVAGVLAIMFQKNWTLTPRQYWRILTQSARWGTGWGTRPNNNYGWGMVNALTAIDSTPAVTTANLIYKSATVKDPGPSGNNNGYLDPGETDSIVVVLKNNGVASATNVTAILRSASAYATVLDSSGSFGTMAVGAMTRQTPAYRVSVSPSVPVNEPVGFVLHTLINGVFHKDINFALNANLPDTTGTDYYVWGAGDDNSGQRIVNALWTKKYKGKFYPSATTLQGLPSISGYRSVWTIVTSMSGTDTANFPLKTGSYSETQIINYLNAGGRNYMEDVDVGWATAGGGLMANLNPYFHYTYNNTTGDYIHGMTGVTGLAYFSAFTGFTMADTGTSDFDSLAVGTSATRFFRANPRGTAGTMIGYDSGVYKTLLNVVPIGALTEGASPSTRPILVDSIMHWFGIQASGVWDEKSPYLPKTPTSFAAFGPKPNPTSGDASFEYQLSAPAHARMVVYNVAGQAVRTLVDAESPAGYHTARWNGRDESGAKVVAGVYLVRFEAGNYSTTKKVVVVR